LSSLQDSINWCSISSADSERGIGRSGLHLEEAGERCHVVYHTISAGSRRTNRHHEPAVPPLSTVSLRHLRHLRLRRLSNSSRSFRLNVPGESHSAPVGAPWRGSDSAGGCAQMDVVGGAAPCRRRTAPIRRSGKGAASFCNQHPNQGTLPVGLSSSDAADPKPIRLPSGSSMRKSIMPQGRCPSSRVKSAPRALHSA